MRPQHHGRPRPCPQEEARSPHPGLYGQKHWNSPSATLPPRPLIFSLQGLSNFQILTEQMTRARKREAAQRTEGGSVAGPSCEAGVAPPWRGRGKEVGRTRAERPELRASCGPAPRPRPLPGFCVLQLWVPTQGASPSKPPCGAAGGVCARDCPGLQSRAERRAPSRHAHPGTWQRDPGTRVSLGP